MVLTLISAMMSSQSSIVAFLIEKLVMADNVRIFSVPLGSIHSERLRLHFRFCCIFSDQHLGGVSIHSEHLC